MNCGLLWTIANYGLSLSTGCRRPRAITFTHYGLIRATPSCLLCLIFTTGSCVQRPSLITASGHDLHLQLFPTDNGLPLTTASYSLCLAAGYGLYITALGSLLYLIPHCGPSTFGYPRTMSYGLSRVDCCGPTFQPGAPSYSTRTAALNYISTRTTALNYINSILSLCLSVCSGLCLVY